MDHIRHSALFNAKDVSVTLIGCGGIGAATALALGKMGVGRLRMFDPDVVSEENLATQMHALNTLDMAKVDAVTELVEQFSDDTEVWGYKERVEADMQLDDYVVVSAVDSIQARKDIWSSVKNSKVRWYIDGRMAAEQLQVYTVDMKDRASVAQYEKMISGEDDSNVPELACTSKATIFCAFLAGAIIAHRVRLIASQQTPARVYSQDLNSQFVFYA